MRPWRTPAASFRTSTATLADASRAKFDAVCRKLALVPDDHLLEIGTGWGGLAIHAARHYGCRVTTTTISQAQYDYARERIAAAGLSGRITLLLEDYRELEGRYDKLVSIEMIEAVGARYPADFFRQLQLAARPARRDAAAGHHASRTSLRRGAARASTTSSATSSPAASSPRSPRCCRPICQATDLKLFHLEDIGPHYARTLAAWRRNFFDHLAEVRRLGYPDSFVRLWEFYLCYCEGGFAERQLGDVQMLLTKPGCRRAPARAPHERRGSQRPRPQTPRRSSCAHSCARCSAPTGC